MRSSHLLLLLPQVLAPPLTLADRKSPCSPSNPSLPTLAQPLPELGLRVPPPKADLRPHRSPLPLVPPRVVEGVAVILSRAVWIHSA